MTRLAGKVALVTGAASGIGAGIARRFGAEGAAVIVQHTGDAAGAARVVAEIVWRGGRAIAVQSDPARWPDVRRLFDDIAATFGRLDILVSNADLSATAAGVSAEAREVQADAMVFGAMLLAQQAVTMFGDRGGHVITLTSGDRATLAPSRDADSPNEGALDAMMRGLARAPQLRVHAIVPQSRGAVVDLAVALSCDDPAPRGPSVLAC